MLQCSALATLLMMVGPGAALPDECPAGAGGCAAEADAVGLAQLRVHSARAAAPKTRGGWTKATFKIGAWQTGTDDAWNLCNGLARKFNQPPDFTGKCAPDGSDMEGTPLPFEACVKACEGNSQGAGFCTPEYEKQAKAVWDTSAEYPIMMNGLESPGGCVIAEKDGDYAAKWQAFQDLGEWVCVPDPAGGSPITAKTSVGHGVGICGTVGLYALSTEAGSPVIAQFQLDTRAWSQEASSTAHLCPDGSECAGGQGCVQPYTFTVDWPAGEKLPADWAAGKCA